MTFKIFYETEHTESHFTNFYKLNKGSFKNLYIFLINLEFLLLDLKNTLNICQSLKYTEHFHTTLVTYPCPCPVNTRVISFIETNDIQKKE